jgi:hypothetical protein
MRTAFTAGIVALLTSGVLFIRAEEQSAQPSQNKKAAPPAAAAEPKANVAAPLVVRTPNNDVEAALDKLMVADFNQSPLSNVLQFIATDKNVRLYIDEAGLAEAMVDRDQQISFQMEGVRLGLVLDLILEPLNLDYAVRDNVLYVSSKDRIHRLVETSVLRIGDVIPPGGDSTDAAERLVNLVTENVNRDQWIVNGGEYNIQFSPDARSLVVTANSRTQRKVAKLIEELRSAKVAQGMPTNAKPTANIAAR